MFLHTATRLGLAWLYLVSQQTLLRILERRVDYKLVRCLTRRLIAAKGWTGEAFTFPDISKTTLFIFRYDVSWLGIWTRCELWEEITRVYICSFFFFFFHLALPCFVLCTDFCLDFWQQLLIYPKSTVQYISTVYLHCAFHSHVTYRVYDFLIKIYFIHSTIHKVTWQC